MPALPVEMHLDLGPLGHRGTGFQHQRNLGCPLLAGVDDREATARPLDPAGVPRLPAARGVEDRGRHHQRPVLGQPQDAGAAGTGVGVGAVEGFGHGVCSRKGGST
jgi:hypothetical protein